VERLEGAQLRRHRIGDLRPAVADLAEPEAGGGVHVGPVVPIEHQGGVTAHQRQEGGRVGGGAGEGMEEGGHSHGRDPTQDASGGPAAFGRVVGGTGSGATASRCSDVERSAPGVARWRLNPGGKVHGRRSTRRPCETEASGRPDAEVLVFP
jgi:hypothetical protein